MSNDPIARVRDDDNRHWMHPWEYMPDAGRADRTIIDRAEGIYLYDTSGARLIDGPGGMWCTQIGYGRREMAEAIAEQAVRLTYFNPFSVTAAPPAGKAALGRMVDARVNLKDSYQRATSARSGAGAAGLAEARRQTAAIVAAVAAHKLALPGLDVRLNGVTGGPSSVRNSRGALSAAAPGLDNESIVRAYLHPSDGRSHVVQLTERGLDLRDRIDGLIRQAEPIVRERAAA